MFGKEEEQQIRERLTGSLRYIVSQRLVPKTTGGRLLITELMGSSLRSREVLQQVKVTPAVFRHHRSRADVRLAQL